MIGVYEKEQGNPGHEAEINCANALVKKYGGSWKHATEKEDKFKHFDIHYNNPNAKEKTSFTFDVKMMKKIRRSDLNPNNDYHYVEFVNGYGYNGWLYGEADWIAFETLTEWIFVDRKFLLEEIIKKVSISDIPQYMGNIKNPSELKYKMWKHNDFDKFTLVENSFLKSIQKFSVEK